MAGYASPWWLPGAHLQTVYPSLFLRGRAPRYRREEWETPDRDTLALDWLDGPAASPRVVLFHGLEGNSASHYATALMRAVRDRGWRGVVVHFRGCGGAPNRLARAYHSGDADEIAWVLARLRAQHPDSPLHAAGVSLGGNALLRWLGREGEAAAAIVDSAAAVSAPIDLPEAGARLCRGLNRLYGRYFLRTLIPKSLAKLDRYPGLYDFDRVRRAGDLREFDDLVTAPLHGFRDAEDYWRRAASKPGLAGIAVPTLILHASNDPFLPEQYLPTLAEVSPAVELEITRGGGHVGFAAGPFPGNLGWMPGRLLDFFDRHPRAAP
jgi:predicted alpha/beta-fold hydrolase